MNWNLEEAIAYYGSQGAPRDQAMLIGLLKEIQRENGGGIPAYQLAQAAWAYGIRETMLLAIIRRIPSLRLENTHCLEICSKCPGGAALGQAVEKRYGAKPAQFTIRYVNCMKQCGKGPNIRWDGVLYSRAEEGKIRSLVEGISQEKTGKD